MPKLRGRWHTFWNAGLVPVRFLEVISPPEFAGYFRELAGLIPPQGGAPDPANLAAPAGRYGLEFDFAALEPLLERYGLRLG